MSVEPDTETLLNQIQQGDLEATDAILARHRNRLRKLVAIRLDCRIAKRIDASDVVQDTLVKAAKRLKDYSRTRPVAFYPWLRRLAIDRITELHREHIRAQRRSVTRETIRDPELSDFGRDALISHLASMGGSPSRRIRLREDVELAQKAIDQLSESDREILELRYVEQLTPREAAAVLEITENAFAQRHLRAIRRVREILSASEALDGK